MPQDLKYIQLQGTKGTLRINFRLKDGSTSFRYRPKEGPVQEAQFPKDRAGQRNTTLKIYDQLRQLGKVSQQERDARFWAAVRAIETVDKAQKLFDGNYASYHSGSRPQDPRSEARSSGAAQRLTPPVRKPGETGGMGRSVQNLVTSGIHATKKVYLFDETSTQIPMAPAPRRGSMTKNQEKETNLMLVSQ